MSMLMPKQSSRSRNAVIVSAILCALFTVTAISATKAVSIVNLLANPKEYRGDRIIVIGYAREAGGFLRLYLTIEDALMWNNASAIRIRDSSSDQSLVQENSCHNAYVEVIGLFGVLEGLGLYGIVDVEQVTRIDLGHSPITEETCWSKNRL